MLSCLKFLIDEEHFPHELAHDVASASSNQLSNYLYVTKQHYSKDSQVQFASTQARQSILLIESTPIAIANLSWGPDLAL